MCGIFAYLNYNVSRERRYILEVLFNGLRRLEYRGYDSSGISIDADLPSPAAAPVYAGSPPLVFRQEGKIECLVRSVYSEVDEKDVNLDTAFNVHAAIAHTRWATHGVPAPRNSHPQSSGPGDEFWSSTMASSQTTSWGMHMHYCNYAGFLLVLKETLIRHGFTFESDTDTEVIPKLAKFVFDKLHDEEGDVTFSQVVMEVMRQLEGAYALIFKSPHYPNELVACKQGSILILGVNVSACLFVLWDGYKQAY
ncbi:hypothetical protein GUJ93_ZPchr0009g2189 [Zizania palustris]|uniref:glutamine--fructose-6-phosphate transaminase (isomerizing) n=1 Tax=Zizania palustris TaxID=103762 RepID=A0A8J5VK43_ZIZPA|nr:hypothetical protein GUJ93_ZPchr0009g2189 [Zizania palustris]